MVFIVWEASLFLTMRRIQFGNDTEYSAAGFWQEMEIHWQHLLRTDSRLWYQATTIHQFTEETVKLMKQNCHHTYENTVSVRCWLKMLHFSWGPFWCLALSLGTTDVCSKATLQTPQSLSGCPVCRHHRHQMPLQRVGGATGCQGNRAGNYGKELVSGCLCHMEPGKPVTQLTDQPWLCE